jgi:uncharacterized small protein (DUF1192 family)
MTKTGTTYFRDELSHWFKTLDFYRNEIPQFEERMIELIRSQSSPDQVSQAEIFINEFAELHNKINLLQMEIRRLKTDPSANGRSNGSSGPQVHAPQDILRNNMQVIEKDFVETKYRCHQFLANVYNAS